MTNNVILNFVICKSCVSTDYRCHIHIKITSLISYRIKISPRVYQWDLLPLSELRYGCVFSPTNLGLSFLDTYHY
jgi:hypothetical protein